MINWSSILEKTILIREFEKVVQSLYFSDCIQSPVHLSIGQELTAVLMSNFYHNGDHLVGNYRSHALALSISEKFEPIVLELLAKRDGVSGGKAGSMHLSVPNKNLMWTSAIVGTGVPIAMGIAEALKRSTKNNLVSVMFGDGALEEGCVIESLNISSVFKLPVVFVLEDNGLAIHSEKKARTALNDYCLLANSYNIKSFSASFKDPSNLYSQFNKAYEYTRLNRLPSFINIECYRWIEHVGVSDDWNLGYRSEKDLNQWRKCDIVENPELISESKEFVEEKSNFYKNFFLEMFERCMSLPNPTKDDLLSNVL